MTQVLFHADSQDSKWLYVVPIAPRKKQVFEAQVEEDEENIDAPNASQEDEDGGHEVNNNDEEVEEQQSSINSLYDDEDIDLEIEYAKLIGMDLDIGLYTMRDVIEDKFDEESLPQINDEYL